MSAEAKFTRLGFDLKERNDVSIVYERSPKDKTDIYEDVVFDLKYTQMEIFQKFDILMLDAVIEQCKELGWM